MLHMIAEFHTHTLVPLQRGWEQGERQPDAAGGYRQGLRAGRAVRQGGAVQAESSCDPCSLKAPGFNPRTYEVKKTVSKFAFRTQLVPIHQDQGEGGGGGGEGEEDGAQEGESSEEERLVLVN
jgi:hypothetical protein